LLADVLPRSADNTYRGHKLALWVFGLLLLMNTVIGLNSIFNGKSVASSADGIPLSEFGAAGAQTVISLFALLGLSRLTVCVVGVVVLVRYRALVPLLFGLFLLSHLSGRLIVAFVPIARTGAPPASMVNNLLLGLLVVGLALSLWNGAEFRASN